jgi:ribosomal protein S12 methylthiotransferase
MKKIYIETLGCSKNQIDSEKMSYLLSQSGFEITGNSEDANIIIVNTCSFIQKAKEEAIETILEMSQLKKKGNCEKVIVSGCLAQQYSGDLVSELPEIDGVFGVGDVSQILEVINGSKKVLIPEPGKDVLTKRKIIGYPGTAYLRISDGCSNYCSYCTIPLIRGSIRSREIETIIEELKFLKTQNIKEVIIIAQDTSNYGIDIYKKRMLSDLLKEIDANLANDDWLRVLYLHPDHIDNSFIESLTKLKHFIPYFDIPFQSGNERILNMMGRKGNSKKYLELINTLKSNFSDIILRSTFITGFPGETDAEFKDTLEFLEKSQIDWVGGFTYSREEGTTASKLQDQVKQMIKDKRLNKLLDLSEQITENRMKRFVGTTQKILIEEKIENEELFLGRFWGQAPDVDGLTVIDCNTAKEGCFSKAEIKRVNGKDLFGMG